MKKWKASNGNMRRVQDGHVARQSITINTADIGKIIAAAKGIVQFEADGHPVNYGEPQFSCRISRK